MRIYAYLRVVSDEKTVRAIHASTGLPNETVKATKAPVAPGSSEVWWNWGTPHIPIDDNSDLDGKVQGVLNRYRPFFPSIRKYSDTADIYLEIVIAHGDPIGIFLSTETVRLLSELGAAVDIDTV